MKKLLLILLLGCYSCSGYKVTTSTTYCNVPKAPLYTKLDNATHIGSDKNLIFLMTDLNMMVLYNEQLKNTISCYEQQIEKKDDKK